MAQLIKRLTEGHHPYAATRAKVLKSLLIDRGNYDKLLKMSMPEIAAFLQNTQYREEFNQLGADFSDIELVEKALNLNMANISRRIMKIISTSGELRTIVGTYLKRLDIYNIKQIVRGKFAGLSEEEIKSNLVPNGGISHEKLLELIKKERVSDIALEIDKSEQMQAAVKFFEQQKSLVQIENTLDYKYYKSIMDVAKAVSRGSLLERFLTFELDALNIKILLRLKKSGFEAKEIMENIRAFGTLGKDFFDAAARDTFENALAKLEKTKYAAAISQGLKRLKETNSLTSIETALDRELLKQAAAFLRNKPLSANPILGFMIAKEVEIRNLRMITRAKHSKLDESFMREQLVIV